MSDAFLKFTEVMEVQSPTQQPQLDDQDDELQDCEFQDDSIHEEFDPEIQIRNSVDLQQVYEHSSRNIFMAQEMLIEPNFSPFLSQHQSLNQSRKLQVESFRVSKGFIPKPPLEKVFIATQKIKVSPVETTRPVTPQKSQPQYEQLLQVRTSLCEFNKKNENKRVSIFLSGQKQSNKSIHIPYRYRGPIPLKDRDQRESLVIKTYRQVKHRMEKSYDKLFDEQQQLQYKKKIDVKKDQNNKYKGVLITYDYNGQLIPLKNSNKKNTIHSQTSKITQTVMMTPLNQNIVLPSAINRSRLEKRKAQVIQKEDEKENESHYTGPQLVTFEGSQFLRKIPKEIDKSKLFRNQHENIIKKSSDQLSFSEFKKNTACFRNLNNCSAELKKLRSRQGFSIAKDGDKDSRKKILKRVHFNHGKMTTNQKIFEKMFEIKPNCEENASQEDDEYETRYKESSMVLRQKETRTFFQEHTSSLHEVLMKKKETGKSLHTSGGGSSISGLSKALKQGIYRSLARQDKGNKLRNSMKDSPRNSSPFETLSNGYAQSMRNENIIHKYGSMMEENMMGTSKMLESRNRKGSEEKVREVESMVRKRKLRFRQPSTLYEDN